jgi:hypothetical protein
MAALNFALSCLRIVTLGGLLYQIEISRDNPYITIPNRRQYPGTYINVPDSR